MLKDNNVDGVVCIALMQLPTLDDDIIEVLKECKIYGKPITVCSAGSDFVMERNRCLERYGIPVYPTPERAVKAMSVLHEYGEVINNGNEESTEGTSKPKKMKKAKKIKKKKMKKIKKSKTKKKVKKKRK